MQPRRLIRPSGMALAAVTLLLGVHRSHAQPANDTCAAATALAAGVPASGTTVGALLDQDMTGICQTDTADVWYAFTAGAAGPYEFTASGESNTELTLSLLSSCDFPMAIYGCAVGTAGSAPRLEQVAFSAGETIMIRVGHLGETGQAFTVSATPLPPPANDECAQAAPLTEGVPVSANNLSATTSVELPMAELCSSIAPGIAAGADVFFSFTPGADGYYDFSTCGSVFDSVVSVHSGCPVSAANVVACNDNTPLTQCPEQFDDYSSYVSGAPLTGGVTYYVRVAGVKTFNPYTGEIGDPGRGAFTLTVQQGVPAVVPVNDTCETAVPLVADTITPGTTVHATGQLGPCDADLGDYWDVWYAYTSAEAVRSIVDFTIDPGAFNGQATLAAYRGCGGELITCQYFSPLGNPIMRITVAVDPGETVTVRVAGMSGVQDDFELVTLTQGVAAPNTSCAAAAPLLADQAVTANTATAATAQESPCGNFDIYPLWYSFTAPEAGYYRLSADVWDGAGTTMTVYPSCGSAALVCSHLGDSVSVNPNAAATSLYFQAGETIRLRVAPTSAQRIPITVLAGGPLPPPPPVDNDICQNAQLITGMPFSASVNITLATQDQDVCAVTTQPPRPTQGGIWYRYTPEVDRVLRGTAGSNGRSALVTVLSGACGSLTQVWCAGPMDFYNPGVLLTAGVEYYFLVSSLPNEHQPGDPLGLIPYGTMIDVEFIAPAVPANDDCETAERLESSEAAFTISTLAADDDLPAPSCATQNGVFSNAMWYTFTTETAGALTVRGTRAPSADSIYTPAGALFTGGCGALTEVACDNATQGFFLTDHFTFTVDLQAGETYHLGIGAWPIAIGDDTDVLFSYTGDIAVACPADWNDNGAVNSSDISAFLTSWLMSVTAPDLTADFNHDGTTNSTDISAFLTAWLDAVVSGC